jgi:ABC-type nitrate/sulfonate/bicarbonate transport system ATPase subunit
LIALTTGTVACRGMPVNGANPGVAMVFQTFALLPWLTVQADTEMGLEARGMPSAERRQRALKMIGLIGLDGFDGFEQPSQGIGPVDPVTWQPNTANPWVSAWPLPPLDKRRLIR